MEPALPIDEALLDDLPDDGNVADMSAEQYMAWVRREAEGLPGVVRVEVDPTTAEQSRARQTAYMPAVQDIPACPEEYLPCESWANDICFQFSQFRANIYNRSLSLETRERKHKVPPMKDEANWELFCFGEAAPTSNFDVDDSMIESTKEIKQDTSGLMAPMSNPVAVIEELEEGEISETIEESCTPPAERPECSSSTPESVSMDVEARNGGGGNDTDLRSVKHTIMKEFQLDDGSVFQLTPRLASSSSGFTVAAIDVIQPPIPGFKASPAAADAPKEVYEVDVTPTVPLLLQFDQVLTSLLFSYHVKWIESAREISYKRGAWLYALMARLLKPLPGDVTSTMRQLYRCCCRLRLDIVESYISQKTITEIQCGKKFGPLEKGVDVSITENKALSDADFENKLGIVNTTIVIAGLYFGQGEEFAQLSET